MSVQFSTRWTFTVVILFLFLGTSKIFSEQSLSRPQSTVFQSFYELLAEIKTDTSAVQVAKLETFVGSHPSFAPSATWLLERYVIARDLSRAESFFTTLPDSDLSLVLKNWMLGNIYSRQGKIEEALKAFTIALTTASPSPELILDFVIFDSRNLRKFENDAYVADLSLEDEVLDVMNAFWYYLNGEWQLAIDRFNDLSQRLQNNLTILYSWGYCFHRSGQSSRAREKWKEGLESARALDELKFEAKFLSNLGTVAETLEATLSYYDSAYAIARQIGDLKRMEKLAGNRGILYSGQGRFSLADSLYRKAINAGRQIQSAWRMAVWYPRLGNLLVQQDRFDEALEAYDEGADLARTAGNTEILIRCQIRVGELYRMLGQFELARRVLTKAYKEARDRGEPRFEVQAHIQLAHLEFATGNYGEARRVYSKYLQEPPRTRFDVEDHTWWRFWVGLTNLAESNYIAARSEFQHAYVLADGIASYVHKVWALLYHAEIDLIENDVERAHDRLNECFELAENTEIDEVFPALYSLRGDAYKRVGELEKAVAQYKKAVNLIEQARKSLMSEASKLDYFGDKSNIYDKLVGCYRELYAATGETAYRDSLYIGLEMKLSRALRELRAENGSPSPDSELDFQREKLREAANRLRTQQRYLRDHRTFLTKQELDSVMAQVQTSRLSLIAQRLRLTHGTTLDADSLQSRIPTPEKLRAILRDNESAIIFYHFSEQPFALTLTGDTTKVVTMPTTTSNLDAATQSLLNPFHKMTKRTDAVFRAELAYELYRTLVMPIEEAMPLPGNLLIVPDAHVANLPFELLLTEKPGQPEYGIKDAPTYADAFLIHRYAISYIPNASFLQAAKRGMGSQNVAVFADPFDEAPMLQEAKLTGLRTGWRFDPLFYSSREAKGIKAIYSNTAIFSRKTATKERFFREAPDYDVIHFATHAFVDTLHDAFSGLVLSTSEDKNDDGILMGYEIANLKLNADLVALSACETGRGRVIPGEGVLGLPRFFLGAGANSVLMTHWKVDDKFAADLMVDFYNYYLKQGLPQAKALTEAKRSVLKAPPKSAAENYRHPLYWASFVMYGEPGLRGAAPATEFVFSAVAGVLLLLLAWCAWSRKFRRLFAIVERWLRQPKLRTDHS